MLDPISGADLRKPLPEAPPGLVLEMTDVGRGDGLLTDLSQVLEIHKIVYKTVNISCSNFDTTSISEKLVNDFDISNSYMQFSTFSGFAVPSGD